MVVSHVNLQPGRQGILPPDTPGVPSRTHRPRHALAGPARDVLDYALFVPCIWLLCGLSVYIKEGGSAILLAVLACFLGYAVLRRTSPPKWLAAFVMTCLIAGIASHYRLFPTSWQVHFRDAAIVRQLAPVVTVFIAAWASKAYFERRLLAGDAFSGAGPILVLSFVVAPIILLQQGFQYEGEDTVSSTLAMYGSFTNNITIALFFVTAQAFCGTGWRRYAGSATLFAIAIVSQFAQFRVMIAGAAAILFGAPGRTVTVALIFTLLGLYVSGVFFLRELLLLAPNSGIRLVFIIDALQSVLDTYGLGIGYGMESVRWRYNFPDRPTFIFLPDPASMTPEKMLETLSVGVHNSFVQALLRTGIIGGSLLLIAFCAVFPRRELPRGMRNHASVLFSIIFIACFVNPAFESPVQGMGVGFIYGYLLALRAYIPNRTKYGSPHGHQP